MFKRNQAKKTIRYILVCIFQSRMYWQIGELFFCNLSDLTYWTQLSFSYVSLKTMCWNDVACESSKSLFFALCSKFIVICLRSLWTHVRKTFKFVEIWRQVQHPVEFDLEYCGTSEFRSGGNNDMHLLESVN